MKTRLPGSLTESWRASTPSSQARLSKRHKVLGVGRVNGLGQRVTISWRVSGTLSAANRMREMKCRVTLFSTICRTNQCDMFHFWSPHSGGGQILFADGAVHFLSYAAAPILPALASRAGNDMAEPF